MTIRIEMMQLAVRIEMQRLHGRSGRFGHPASEHAISAATLISVATVLAALGHIAGAL